MRTRVIAAVLLLAFISAIDANKQPNYQGDRTTMVHLFEWTWPAIADECERFLGPKGFGGVQISPPNEHCIVKNRPWWERYQPISYLLHSRSGTAAELQDMIARCNRAGVRIYVDAVLNHMSGGGDSVQVGSAGSAANYAEQQYPAVPYGPSDFNAACEIVNYQEAQQVRNCRLVSLLDLNQRKPYVRQVLVNYLNELIRMGVAGFRVDAAKHMWPEDLKHIYENLQDLSRTHGFAAKTRPFIYQEVIDLGSERIKSADYAALGCVTEFKHSHELGRLFRRRNPLKWLRNWGTEWSLLPSPDALVFVDNHDNQRGHGPGGDSVLTYKDGLLYQMALLYMLAHPYGHVRLMSSYDFNSTDQGPPNAQPRFLPDGQCDGTSGWICEHRWPVIARLVRLRNVAGTAALTHWWSQHDYQIAFARNQRAFVAINLELQHELSARLQTGLPPGTYCDIVGGEKSGSSCTHNALQVEEGGWLQLKLPPGAHALALHIEAKL